MRAKLLHIWEVMQALRRARLPPDGRAAGRAEGAASRAEAVPHADRERPAKPLDVMDWVNAYALAVNEENAAGGRVVTAPDQRRRRHRPRGAALLPALRARRERRGRHPLPARRRGDRHALQEERLDLGRRDGLPGRGRCRVLDGGGGPRVAALQGTNEQVENAAEIGMEHNLGLTCDPVAGLVQIPCIERNAMGSVKAINAARLAMRGDGTHKVSLDQVIATMRQTGRTCRRSTRRPRRGARGERARVLMPALQRPRRGLRCARQRQPNRPNSPFGVDPRSAPRGPRRHRAHSRRSPSKLIEHRPLRCRVRRASSSRHQQSHELGQAGVVGYQQQVCDARGRWPAPALAWSAAFARYSASVRTTRRAGDRQLACHDLGGLPRAAAPGLPAPDRGASSRARRRLRHGCRRRRRRGG